MVNWHNALSAWNSTESEQMPSSRYSDADMPSFRQPVDFFDDGVGINTVMAIEIADRAGLAEMLDPE